MRRNVFTIGAAVTAAWLAFQAIAACAQNSIEPGTPLDVQYATNADGTLFLIPPDDKLLRTCYGGLSGATNANNTLAWKILNSVMVPRPATAEDLAKRDPSCGGLDAFELKDHLARIEPLYEAEIKRVNQFGPVQAVWICGAPNAYDFKQGGFAINARSYGLFTESKLYELPLIPMQEDQAHTLVRKQMDGHGAGLSYSFVALFRGNLIPPGVAFENQLSGNGLLIDVRHVEVHLMEFKYTFGTDSYKIVQDTKLDEFTHEYKSSLGVVAGSIAPATAPATGGSLADYIRVNPEELNVNGQPDSHAIQLYRNSPLDSARFSLRFACLYGVALSKRFNDLKSSIATMQADLDRKRAAGASAQQLEYEERRIDMSEKNLAAYNEPLNRAQAYASLAHLRQDGEPVVPLLYLNFLYDLTAPDTIPSLAYRLQTTHNDLVRFGSQPNVSPSEVQRIADLNHRIENVKGLIARGQKDEAQKELDSLWEWALHEPLNSQAEAVH